MAVTGTTAVSENDILDALRDSLKREKPKPKAGDTLGKDEFMKLLIAQLKNQDPLSPMDDKQFISQQAQFSSLEQMTAMNKNFETFISQMQSSMLADRSAYAVSYLGSTVSVADPSSESGSLTGRVTEVRYREGLPVLVVNDKEWELSAVSSVRL